MIARTIKEHQARNAAKKEALEAMRKEAILSADGVSSEIVDILNSGVAEVFTNQRQLEQETKNVSALTARFTKQTAQWLSMVESFNQALKEIGDVENWARVIENDMRIVAGVLEAAEMDKTQNATEKT